jgi:hypothetical protein
MLLVILGSAAFVGGCIWILSKNRGAVDLAIGGVGILFFGACGIAGVKRLTLPPKFLVLNKIGLKSDAFPGFAEEVEIKWADVINVSTFTVNNIPNVVIQTKDPTGILATMPMAPKMIAQANVALCGSPLVLCSMNFGVSHSELLSSIETAWQDGRELIA